jgi:hypothetical protein
VRVVEVNEAQDAAGYQDAGREGAIGIPPADHGQAGANREDYRARHVQREGGDDAEHQAYRGGRPEREDVLVEGADRDRDGRSDRDHLRDQEGSAARLPGAGGVSGAARAVLRPGNHPGDEHDPGPEQADEDSATRAGGGRQPRGQELVK